MAFTIEQPITAINFAIDGVVLANQPFSIDYALAEPSNNETVRGFRIARQSRGRQAVVTWGEDQATPASVAEVRARLGSTLEHLISWIDPDGTVVSIPIIAPAIETEFAYAAPGFYEPMTLRFVERAPLRVHGEGDCNLVLLDTDITGGVLGVGGNLAWDLLDANFVTFTTGVQNREVWGWDGALLSGPVTSAVSNFIGQPVFHPTQSPEVLFYVNQSAAPTQRPRAFNYAAGVIGSLIGDGSRWPQTGGFATGISVAPDGSGIAIETSGGAALARLMFYPWTGAAFGTRIDVSVANNPNVPSVSGKHSVDFHPDGDFVACTSETAPYVYVYSWDGATFGAPVNPTVPLVPGVLGVTDVRWHPSGNYLAVAHDDQPFVTVYPWNGTTLGTPIVPAMIAAGGGRGMIPEWSKLGTVLYLAGQTMDSARSFYAYTFDPVLGTFGARCDPDSGPPTTTLVSGAERSRDNQYIVIREELSAPNNDVWMYRTGLDII